MTYVSCGFLRAKVWFFRARSPPPSGSCTVSPWVALATLAEMRTVRRLYGRARPLASDRVVKPPSWTASRTSITSWLMMPSRSWRSPVRIILRPAPSPSTISANGSFSEPVSNRSFMGSGARVRCRLTAWIVASRTRKLAGLSVALSASGSPSALSRVRPVDLAVRAKPTVDFSAASRTRKASAKPDAVSSTTHPPGTISERARSRNMSAPDQYGAGLVLGSSQTCQPELVSQLLGNGFPCMLALVGSGKLSHFGALCPKAPSLSANPNTPSEGGSGGGLRVVATCLTRFPRPQRL